MTRHRPRPLSGYFWTVNPPRWEAGVTRWRQQVEGLSPPVAPQPGLHPKPILELCMQLVRGISLTMWSRCDTPQARLSIPDPDMLGQPHPLFPLSHVFSQRNSSALKPANTISGFKRRLSSCSFRPPALAAALQDHKSPKAPLPHIPLAGRLHRPDGHQAQARWLLCPVQRPRSLSGTDGTMPPCGCWPGRTSACLLAFGSFLTQQRLSSWEPLQGVGIFTQILWMVGHGRLPSASWVCVGILGQPSAPESGLGFRLAEHR